VIQWSAVYGSSSLSNLRVARKKKYFFHNTHLNSSRDEHQYSRNPCLHPIDDQSQLHIHQQPPHRQIRSAISGENGQRWRCSAAKAIIGGNHAHRYMMQRNGKIFVDLTCEWHRIVLDCVMMLIHEFSKWFEGTCTPFVSCNMRYVLSKICLYCHLMQKNHCNRSDGISLHNMWMHSYLE